MFIPPLSYKIPFWFNFPHLKTNNLALFYDRLHQGGACHAFKHSKNVVITLSVDYNMVEKPLAQLTYSVLTLSN